MGKLSTKGLIAVALVFSLLAAGLVYSYLKNIAAQTMKQGQPVVVAKVDIPAKTKMTAEMLKVVNVPDEFVQPGAVKEIGKAVGVVAREQIVTGEQVTERRLFIEGRTGGFTSLIPAGKRAVSVAVTEVTGVAGMVKPGDYVDIVATFDPDKAREHIGQMFIQNVRVLAINREIEPSGSGATTDSIKKDASSGKVIATLAVSPEDATRLTVADDKGKIRMALRPYLAGDTVVDTYAWRPVDLLNKKAEPVVSQSGAPAAPPPPEKGIMVIRGTKTEMIPVK